MKRFKKKKKVLEVTSEPAKVEDEKWEIKYENMWCPRCGAEGEEYLRVASKATHYSYLNCVDESGYIEEGDEMDYEYTDSEIFCMMCHAQGIPGEEVYEFSVEVLKNANEDEGNHLEVAENIIRNRQSAALPF